MVPYHEESVAFAWTLTQSCRTHLDKFKKITSYITKFIRYDYVRAITIPKKNGKPDVPRTWEKQMGICIDIAALTTGMLRGVGIRAVMCVGKADRKNHAWVEAEIDGKRYRYDHDGKAKKYVIERTY